MATQALGYRSSRAKQLRWVLGAATLAAVAEGVRSIGFFVVNDHWKSLVYAVIKLVVVIGTAFMAWKQSTPESGLPSATENLLALKVAISAVLISFLADQSFLQNRW